MELSVEHLFGVEAMVHGYHEYFRAGVKFCMGLSSFACYHHQTSNPEVCLCTRWLKKYPKIIFSHSTLHSGQVEAVTSGLKLKVFRQHHPCCPHIRVPHIFQLLIFWKRIFWTRKYWWFSYNSPNSPKFSPSKILYHGISLYVCKQGG